MSAEKFSMSLGFNQNVTYGGESYHVQTEDGGRRNPVVTTLLFKGGVIIASRRTDYSDIVKSDKLEVVIRDIIRRQHTSVVDELMRGEFAAEKKEK